MRFVSITDKDGGVEVSSLDHLLEENEITAEERGRIERGEAVVFGGGAAPIVTVELFEEARR